MAELPDGIKITWLGHATFRLRTPAGKSLIIDPWLSGNPSCPDDHKDQSDVDAILVTHGHSDHTGDLIELARSSKAPVVAMVELIGWLSTKGIEQSQLVEMNKGGTVEVAGCRVHMTNAQHSSSIEEGGSPIYAGEPAGFVVEFDNGFKVYHSGDTAVMADMGLIGSLLEPDVALLCIGDHYTMGPRSAAAAIRLLGVKTVVPMHYGTFPVLTGTPDQLREEAKDVDGLEVIALDPGDTI